MALHCIAMDNPPSWWSLFYGTVQLNDTDGNQLQAVTGASPLNDTDKSVMPEYNQAFEAYRLYGISLLFRLGAVTTVEIP